MSDRRHGSIRAGSAVRARPPQVQRVGPFPITATGVLIAIALVLSLAYVGYAITVRDPSQIPLLASGLVVVGLVFMAIAGVGGRAAWRSSVRGSDARAFGHAIVGGIAALVAAGCIAGAVILFLVGNG
jgi:type III secretory pathway component EscV